MKKISHLFSIVLFFLLLTIETNAQLPNDMRNVKAAQITDAQLQDFVQKASASGLSEAQVIQEFSKRGMAATEIDILKKRMSSTNTNVANPIVPTERTVAKPAVSYIGNTAGLIFGSELFNTPNLSFEPDLRIPTPKNYVLGPDDQLLLDVFGVNLSQQILKVNTEGAVSLKYAGPVQVSGLTIEEASQLINKKLTKFYPALASGQTKANLTLTGIRTIKIMVIGAAKKPGTYSLTSLATLFNALYVSGGPTDNGSFRKIELIRNNKVIQKADLYDFLINSNQKSNLRLMDNDIIKIPFVTNKINIIGEINREGFYEMLPGETLQNALNFAGGYKTNAYKARITGSRVTDWDKKVIDIIKDSIKSFVPQDGDQYIIGSIIEKYQNKITVEGAVYKPGDFALTDGLTLEDLIKKAEGLREDVYTGRAILVRTKDDLTKEYINLNLVSPESKKLVLKKDDIVKISSIFDLKDNYPVTITGAVRNAGSYAFEENLSLKALILQAGGFAENATGKGIEISRRKKDVDVNNPNAPIVEIIKIDDDKDLSKTSADVLLKPFDVISIKVDPYYKSQISVNITGDVLNPGSYTLTSRAERISDLIKRAGNVLYTANLSGARLIRRNYSINDASDAETAQKIAASAAKDSSGVVLDLDKRAYKEVSIALTKIMDSPGGKDDILLEEGDQVIIPSVDNMVSISGEVFKPLSINYEGSKKLRNYLSDAGGVTRSGNKNKIFVVYPNGKAASTKKVLLFFRKYPAVTAGTKIYVPQEPEKKQLDLTKTSIIISAFSALTTSLFIAYQMVK